MHYDTGSLWEQVQCSLERRGDKVAVIDLSQNRDHPPEWTGLQLLIAVENVSRCIRGALNIHKQSAEVVAVYLSASCTYVAAVLAALKLGLPFMPLDPSWPKERTKDITRIFNPCLVLWTQEDVVGGGHGCPRHLDDCHAVEVLQTMLHVPTVTIAGDPAMREAPRLTSLSDIAYIMFTSGSTGKPLGVKGTAQGEQTHGCCQAPFG